MRRLTIMRLILICLGAAFIGFGSLLVAARLYPASEPSLGVSYSLKYADELGIDRWESLEFVLSELRPAHVRLKSYWDLHEPSPGEFDFADLDKQLDIAGEHQVEVLLAIGQRQPRWPECHIPQWADELDEKEYRAALINYLEVVTERYRDHPALAGYHLENEAANRAFGHCPEFDNRFLRQKFQAVKRSDPSTPITISVSNQYGIPLQPPIADEYAMSIYRQAHFELWGRQVHWNYSFVPAEWHRLRSWMIAAIHQRSNYIHELQTEPWGEQATVDLSHEEQMESMNPARIEANVEYAEQIGAPKLYLWGMEWWYWRLNEFDDEELWRTIENIYH